jgi:plastocyanin
MTMRGKLALLTGLLLASTACGDGADEEDPIAPPDGGPAQTVSMPGFTFSPFTTSISVGGTVIFDFPSEPHNVIFERKTGAPADIQATTNRTVSRVFSLAGTFPYDCTLHPGMSGQVIVR